MNAVIEIFGPYPEVNRSSGLNETSTFASRRKIVEFMFGDMAGFNPYGEKWELFSFGDLFGTVQAPVIADAYDWRYVFHETMKTNGMFEPDKYFEEKVSIGEKLFKTKFHTGGAIVRPELASVVRQGANRAVLSWDAAGDIPDMTAVQVQHSADGGRTYQNLGTIEQPNLGILDAIRNTIANRVAIDLEEMLLSDPNPDGDDFFENLSTADTEQESEGLNVSTLEQLAREFLPSPRTLLVGAAPDIADVRINLPGVQVVQNDFLPPGRAYIFNPRDFLFNPLAAVRMDFTEEENESQGQTQGQDYNSGTPARLAEQAESQGSGQDEDEHGEFFQSFSPD